MDSNSQSLTEKAALKAEILKLQIAAFTPFKRLLCVEASFARPSSKPSLKPP